MAEGGSHNVISFDGIKADNVQVFVQGRTDRESQGSNNRSNNSGANRIRDSSSEALESDGRPVYETDDGIRATANEKRPTLFPKPDPTDREKIRGRRSTILPEEWINLSKNIKIERMNPLKRGARVFSGKKKFGSEWRDVAIKLIPDDEESLKEVGILMNLERHPNVIQIYDADSFHHPLTPYIYIVMEYCPQTLEDYIDGCKGKRFDFVKNWSYAKQLVEGVAHIHKKKILHRDIKPENLLLTDYGEYLRVANFGVSKTIMDNQSQASVSTVGKVSDGFLAPEMLQRNPKASFYSDAYSIGIVLALLFSKGYHPFDSDPNIFYKNIIDHKRLDLDNIVMFGKPYAGKRNELMSLLEQIINHDPRSRPCPEDMLRSPFFERLEERTSSLQRLAPKPKPAEKKPERTSSLQRPAPKPKPAEKKPERASSLQRPAPIPKPAEKKPERTSSLPRPAPKLKPAEKKPGEKQSCSIKRRFQAFLGTLCLRRRHEATKSRCKPGTVHPEASRPQKLDELEKPPAVTLRRPIRKVGAQKREEVSSQPIPKLVVKEESWEEKIMRDLEKLPGYRDQPRPSSRTATYGDGDEPRCFD